MALKIYHNPHCSKSRATLAILEDRDAGAEMIKYLETPPSALELKNILAMLGIGPRDLIRKGEAVYKTLGLDDDALGDDDLITAMVENPKLIERPIVVKDGKAAIGRPPESVIEIL